MIEIYLGTFSGGWAIDGRTQGWSSHVAAPEGLERWVGDIARRHASRWRKPRVVLWLSGGLARPCLCGPVAGLSGWQDAEAFAASAAPEATGLEGPCQVRLEDWPGEVPVLCTAIDAALGDAIQALAKSHRIVWHSVRPRWAALLDEALLRTPSTRLVCLAEEDALTLVGGPASNWPPAPAAGFELASTYAPAPDADQATALWHRMLLSLDVQPDDAWFAQLEPVVEGEATAPVAGAANAPAWPRLAQPTQATA